MEKGFVLLREFIYGLDFTEFDSDENIVIHETEEEAQAEVDWEYEECDGKEPSRDLSIAQAYVDDANHVVAINDNGNTIVRSEEPIS